MSKQLNSANWHVKPLSEICKVVSGGTPSRDVPEYWFPSEIVWVTPTDITSDSQRTLTDSKEKISKKGLSSSSAKLLPVNTILMTSRATLGEIKIAKVECCTNQGFKSLIPNENVDPWFLYYQMKRKKSEYERLGIGSTFLEVNKKDTDSFQIEIPDYLAQKKIAKILITINQLIEKTQALIDKHTAIKQGMMADLFTRGIDPTTGQLRPPVEQAPHLYKETELGWVPKEWDVCQLEEYISLLKSGLSRRIVDEDIGIPVIISGNIQDGQFDNSSLKYWYRDDPQGANIENYILDDKDILLCFINSIEQIGKVCIYKSIGRDCIYTTNLFRIKASELTEPEFLFLLLASSIVQDEIHNITKPAINQASFTTGDFKKILVPLIDKNEQEEIARHLKLIGKKIDKDVCLLGKLKNTKSGLMQDLLTGKVRVTDCNIEDAG